MYDGKSVLGLIPARGGSKGLPGKNIRNLMGKPLIAWTIEEAIVSSVLDRIIVTTDDMEIAEISKRFGAEVPFMRPAEFATDTARGIDVVFHALEWLAKHNFLYDLVVLLQPTSPLRKAEDIVRSLELFQSKKAGAVVSVCECEHSPLWTNTIGEDLSMRDFLNSSIHGKNRQEIPDYYRLNGAVYVADWNYLERNEGFFGDKTYALVMPKERSVDIDTELDFNFAEFLLEHTLHQRSESDATRQHEDTSI